MNSGGAERVVSRLSYILNEDYNVFVILFEDTYMKYNLNGTVINLGVPAKVGHNFKRILLPFRRARILKKIKKDKNLDVVISFLDSPNMVNFISRTNICKTILSIRNFDTNYKNFILRYLFRFLYSKADKVITVSQVINEKISDEYNLSRENVITIYNPYDLYEIKISGREEIKEEYKSFFESNKVFISVGRQVYQKGFWHLIKAFKKVHDIDPEARLVIVGREESGGKSINLVKELGLEKKVLFTGYEQNPYKYMARSNIYVVSSLYEGFPNSMVEAMGAGCAILAADCKSGPREILYKSPNLQDISFEIEYADFGILVPPLSKIENWDKNVLEKEEIILSNAMLTYIQNPSMQERYSEKALERVKDFNYEKCKTEFECVINA
nr:glycosyltransferase [Planococcus sp. ISL-110]